MSLTVTETQGFIEGDRFIVHKGPQHFFRLYGGFGVNAGRLSRAFRSGVKLAVILYHPAPGITKLYKVSIEKWLNGLLYCNKKQLNKSLPEYQRIISISECETDE